jgi:dipeptidyl aminopeptidase/acylaminoacyl peptidase
VVNADGSGSHDIAEGTDPNWSPSGSEIAFQSRGPQGARISIVNGDGTGLRQLGAGESPSWSPDGTKIAFIRKFALFVMRADGTGARRIVPQGKLPHEPTWSPGERRIAFLSYTPSGIFTVNADGSARKRLTTTAADGAPDWSPDGRRLVFPSGRDDLVPDETDESEIFVINAGNGTGLQPLTFMRPDEWQTIGQIRSARGRILASFESKGTPHAVVLSGSLAAVLTRLVTGAKHIALFAARSGELRGLVPVLHDSAAPLAVNDRWVVFAVGRSIRGITVRTRAKRLLARASGTPIGLSISGRRVAWAENARGRGRVRAFLLPR